MVSPFRFISTSQSPRPQLPPSHVPLHISVIVTYLAVMFLLDLQNKKNIRLYPLCTTYVCVCIKNRK
jgi:hypothetical protein